jgi:hypothetical protein
VLTCDGETRTAHDLMGRARNGRERCSGVEHTMSELARTHDLWAEPVMAVSETGATRMARPRLPTT